MTTTTLCYAWEIVRTDSVAFRLTDHDQNVLINGHTFSPSSGIMTTKVVETLGLQTDDFTLQGSVDDDSITEADLESGKFDDASVKIWLVNWSDPSDLRMVFNGKYGPIRLTDDGFETDLLSIVNALTKPNGRVYSRQCDAVLGDAKCKFDTTGVANRLTTTVTFRDGLGVRFSDLTFYVNGWFSDGTLVTSTGKQYPIKSHSGNNLILWEEPVPDINVNDTVTIIVGCNKTSKMCRERFNNFVNFRGYATLMPGQDSLTTYPIRGHQTYEGGSLFDRDD